MISQCGLRNYLGNDSDQYIRIFQEDLDKLNILEEVGNLKSQVPNVPAGPKHTVY